MSFEASETRSRARFAIRADRSRGPGERLLGALAAVMLAAGALVVTGGASPVGATGSPPPAPLNNVMLAGFNGLLDPSIEPATAGCSAAGFSYSFSTSGPTIAGPYPGTFTETGTVVVGPDLGLDGFVPPNGIAVRGEVLSFDSSFVITSGDITITGTKHWVSTTGGVLFTCANFDEVDPAPGGPGVQHDHVRQFDLYNVAYEAVIVTPSGSFSDAGQSLYQYDKSQVGFVTSFPALGGIKSAAVFRDLFYGSDGDVQSLDSTPPTVDVPSFSVNPKAVGESTLLSATAADEPGGSGLAGGEYFLGADPGPGSGTPMALSASTLSASIGSSLPTGVYTAGVRARDVAGNWSVVSTAMLVVFDPSAGFATGGGWLVPGGKTSDTGDSLPGLDGTSKANFGFVVKYANGASTVPGGSLEFHYNVGKFHLRSSGMDWLVVTNSNWARFQGLATIDGASGSYRFRVEARDGDSAGGGQADRFLITIWGPGADPNSNAPVYKASGDVSGGQIVIHR